MNIFYILLIVLVFLLLLGPLMLVFAKLNKVDPYILEKTPEEIEKDSRSFVLINALKPLYYPLWIEKRIIDLFRKK